MALKYSGPPYLSMIERVNHSEIEIQRLLHLLHTTYILTPEKYSESDARATPIPCASELEEKGIVFKKSDGTNPNDLLDIKFRKGVIEIPNFVATGMDIALLCNFIAFEQCVGARR